MKKRIYEAQIPLRPGEQQILSTYQTVAPAMRQSLDFLRKKNPNTTLQQAAQQLLQTPQFANNQQLGAISRLRDQDVQSSGQVAQMFAKNPVQRVQPPPAAILNQVPAQQRLSYDPVEYSKTIEQERARPESPEDKQRQNAELAQVGQNIQNWTNQMQQQKGQPVGSMGRDTRKVDNNRTMKVEAFNMATLGTSLQKIMKAVSALRPEELSMLMKMITSMMAGPGATNSVGQTSMTRSTMTSSQKYTQKQLIEQLKKDILKEELISSVKIQTENYRLTESLLREGPFSNVWQGIKSAGTSMFNKVKSIGDRTGLVTGKVSPEEQSKAYSGELMKAIKKAHQTRQQFKSQVLKNAEIINQYHDAVSGVWDAFSHVGDSLGAHSGPIKSQVEELVSNLKYDLESEKEQIASFLKVLGDLRGQAPDSSMARGAAEFKRHQEAEAARRMKNPITGKRMADSAVDPEILKDKDKDLVDALVKKAIRGDKDALDQLRKIQEPKMKAAIKAEKAKKASSKAKDGVFQKTEEKHE